MICTEPSFDTVARFNELPNLWDVNEAKNEQVTEETFKTLGQLFVAHHVKSIFGLTLLHNHFLLEEGEILLEPGQPVKTDKLASSAQGFNWRITPDKSYVPYEFRPATKNLTSSPVISNCSLKNFTKVK
ncbi:4581_t:CDS:2 [Entrophospora sp. SA101]|nr:4580_t:CDS:2 [Entrophospora sp. SA101]CAJ0838109.1 4581_t:CDS:2 [Entrophospora sp. SA101]